MIPSARERTPFFTAFLVILPVLLLAALGAYSLRQDRASVELEARQRAGEIARDLSSWLEHRLASELSTFALTGTLWAGDGVIGGSVLWPGESPPGGPEAMREAQRKLEEWQANHPGLEPAGVFPVSAILTAEGNLHFPAPYEFPPLPAPWTAELSPGQQSLWNEIRRQECPPAHSHSLRAAVEEFLASNPPPSARAGAEFELLLIDLDAHDPHERVERLTRFARRHFMHFSESGVALSSLALARSIQESAPIGLTEPLFRALSVEEMQRPSFLTQRLMEQQKELADGQSPEIQRASARLFERWEARQALLARTRALQEMLRPTTLLTTNVWMDWEGSKWFAILSSGEIHSMTASHGHPVTNIIPVTNIEFFPEPAVKRAAERALADAPARLPPYLTATLTLENRIVSGRAEISSANAPILATLEGRLTRSAVHLLDSDATGLSFSEPFESLPSRPRFVIQVLLADPGLLYAQATWRARVFGFLILAALAAALFGFLKTFQALRRQQELSELKSNFVSSVSHELRAPIASVRLMAEGLERGTFRQPDKQRDYFKLIVQECRRLSSLIENLLDFSRIEQGRKQYEFEPTDVAALAGETVRLMEPCARERQVTLALENDPRFTACNFHPTLDGKAIQQALINLIDNALKHSPANSTVTVGLSLPEGDGEINTESGAQPGSFTLWIEDQGEGIPPGEHQLIFDRFYRRGSELRRETEGAGIGLSIVKHIVEAHHGSIQIKSAPAQGSRFTLQLPNLQTATNRKSPIYQSQIANLKSQIQIPNAPPDH